jgi:hypothetical protein
MLRLSGRYRPNVLIVLRSIVGFDTVGQDCGEVPKVVKGIEILKAAMEPTSQERDSFANPSVQESKVMLEGTLVSQPMSRPSALFDSGQHELWYEVYPKSWQKHSASIQSQGTSSVANSAVYLGQPIRADAKILADPFFEGTWYELFLDITQGS